MLVAHPKYEVWDIASGELAIHARSVCAGRTCTIHNPSTHAMNAWPMHWRPDRHMMERMCPTHNVGHPDPDDAAYRARQGDHDTVHNCCGCC